jgi:hypothetical protein
LSKVFAELGTRPTLRIIRAGNAKLLDQAEIFAFASLWDLHEGIVSFAPQCAPAELIT